MKFLKNSETDLDLLRKLCGEMINIECGKLRYKDGVEITTEGEVMFYDAGDTKYSIVHNSGNIYVPPQWPKSDMREFATALSELLESEFTSEHLNRFAAGKTLIHTTELIPLSAYRNIYIADAEEIPPEDGFTWVLRPMDNMVTNERTYKNSIESIASIIFDKYDVFDVEDGGVIDEPSYHNLRVYPQIQSLKDIKITDYKHTDYFNPFPLNPKAPLHNLNDVLIENVEFDPANVVSNNRAKGYACTGCNHPTFGQIYLQKLVGVDRGKCAIYCAHCIHEYLDASETNTLKISVSPGTIEEYMELMKIPDAHCDVYAECKNGITKVKLDRVHPGHRLFQIGAKYIVVDDTNFKKFIMGPRALEVAKLGKIVPGVVELVK